MIDEVNAIYIDFLRKAICKLCPEYADKITLKDLSEFVEEWLNERD